MEAIGYLDLSQKKLYDSLGGSLLVIPEHSYGEDLTLGLRFAKRVDGAQTEVSKTVSSLSCSIGLIDARPESGEWSIRFDPSGTPKDTAALRSASKAADLKSAIETAAVGLGVVSVEQKNGSFLVRLADEDTTTYPTPLEIEGGPVNSLFPISFLRHRPFELDGKWVHEIRLVQAPVASTSNSSRVNSPSPTIATVQDGGTDNDTIWNEIQSLYLPLSFRGLYQIKRGFARTRLLDLSDGPTEIAEALKDGGLADEGGIFNVTNPTDNYAHIEFAGDMAGTNQDPLEVSVHSAPEGDLTFTVSLNTPELATLLRRQDSVTLPIEIRGEIEDDDDDQVTYRRVLFTGEITLNRELHWEELSAAAQINWLRPPLPDRYEGFDYSQVSNGQLHYSETKGDGSTTVFTIDHNLDVNATDVVVKEISSGDLLVHGTDYTVSVTNSNSLDVTATSAPATNDWRITVLGLELTSYFDPHTHPIADITNLQTILDDLGTRMTDLEQKSGNGPIVTRDENDADVSFNVRLPSLFEVFPTRRSVTEVGRIVDLDASQAGRARGLLAAVHDATTESLPSPIPTAADSYIGRVFENDSGDTVTLPGGKGHRSVQLKDGEFAACDGRLWYPVARYGDQDGVDFTTDYSSDANQIDCADNELPNGTRVQLTTTGTLPDPLATATDYYVVNRTDDSIELAATVDGTPIDLTDDGTGTHTVTKAVETSYYPTNFERTLFQFPINEKQLRLRKTLECRFALEAAVLSANTNAMWTVAFEVGERTQASTPATPGQNLASIKWRGSPLWEQQIDVTNLSTIHRLGLSIQRSMVSSVDTLTTHALLYGAKEGGVVSPKTANFLLRCRLIRFDTEDGQSDPSGFVALKGLAMDGDGANVNEGSAIIR